VLYPVPGGLMPLTPALPDLLLSLFQQHPLAHLPLFL
jgi:hypothetical protein